MKNIQKVFSENLRKHCAIGPDELVVAAISGGPDSLALLELLLQAGQRVIVGHFDHQLRKESARDADFVRRISAEKKVPCDIGTGDVNEYSKRHKTTIEESARILRYNFLFSLAREHHANVIAVGHNADDQVETVLMHLLRGSGLSGMAGMHYRQVLPAFDSNIALVRPLLDIWRSDIDAYCLENKLDPVIDKTNENNTYYRNRLRNELIPYLQSYNPNVKASIHKLSKVVITDLAFIQENVFKQFEAVCRQISDDLVAVSRQKFLQCDKSIQLNLLVYILKIVTGEQGDYDFDLINKILFYIENPPKSKFCHIYGKVWLNTGADEFVLSIGKQALSTKVFHQLPDVFNKAFVPGTPLDIQNGYWLKSEILSKDNVSEFLYSKFSAALDFDKLSGVLSVSNRKQGSRFAPLGMDGKTQKVSDYFINQKIPVQFREKYPLIFSGDEIAWIPGFQISDLYKIDSNTQTVLIMTIEKLGP